MPEATTLERSRGETRAGWQVTAPVSLLAELTHRCPLQCPYCSNPLALEKAGVELDTATWLRVLEEAAVVISPGAAYGPSGEGFVRMSLTVPDERLNEAAERISALVRAEPSG